MTCAIHFIICIIKYNNSSHIISHFLTCFLSHLMSVHPGPLSLVYTFIFIIISAFFRLDLLSHLLFTFLLPVTHFLTTVSSLPHSFFYFSPQMCPFAPKLPASCFNGVIFKTVTENKKSVMLHMLNQFRGKSQIQQRKVFTAACVMSLSGKDFFYNLLYLITKTR